VTAKTSAIKTDSGAPAIVYFNFSQTYHIRLPRAVKGHPIKP